MSLRPLPLAAAALLVGCAALQPSSVGIRGGRSTSGARPRVGDLPNDPAAGPTADPSRADVPAGPRRTTAAATTRRICRSGSRPAGWIAVAYEAESGDECPRAGTTASEHPIAVYVRYAGQPVQTTLEICADQPIPFEWVDDGAVDSGQCPGAGPDGASAMKRIRKVR